MSPPPREERSPIGDRTSTAPKSSAFERYVNAWNVGNLEAWLEAQDPAVEYVSLASGDAVTYRGHEGMREVWRESRANWEAFRFSILDRHRGDLEVGFSGTERLQQIEINGVLWFRYEEREGRIRMLWAALDQADLP